MGVAEGRQIACGEIRRHGALGFDELVGRNETETRTVRGPSGRPFRLTTEIFDDYEGFAEKPDRDDHFQGVAVIVEAVGPGRLPLKFREAIVLSPDFGETIDDLSSRPMTYREEVQHRALDTGCLVLLAPLMVLLILSARLGAFDEEDDPA